MTEQKLSLNTFYSLVEERASENNKMEFKKFSFLDGKVSHEQKEKLEKEIAAFANADGGIIYIGIDESKDKVASQVVGVGCGIDKLDEIQLAIQSRLLAKVHPRIYGINIVGLSLSESDMVIAITIPRSISRPHAVNDGNKDNFYIRHSNGITNMSLDDLRREILSGASYQNEIKRYRQDRIGMIMSNEYIRNLKDGAKIILHIIPFWSMDYGNIIDLSNFDSLNNSKNLLPIHGGGYNYAFCADGKLTYSIPFRSDVVRSSVLLSRNGIIEAVDVCLMNYAAENSQAFPWSEAEAVLHTKITKYTSILEELDIPRPWYISICIVNGKGYWTTSYGDESIELHSNYIQGVDVIWNEGQALNEIIQPCFDSLANAFGYANSFIDFS